MKEKNQKGGKPMTQLIGVLCENKEKVILMSDRMVSTMDDSLAFEHESKCAFISPYALVLTAGTIHEPELINETKDEIKGKSSILKIAESLSRNYRKIRKQRIEHEILEKVGISSFEEFHKKQQILHDVIIQDLSENIEKYSLGVHFVLGGKDEKAHLYQIGTPGTYRSFDELGFCCVGSGDRHAEPVFAFYGFSPKMSVQNALSIAFEAKKRAEMAGGVGRELDAWIIEKTGIFKISDKTIKELEEHHAKQEDFSKLLKAIEIKKEKIKNQEA